MNLHVDEVALEKFREYWFAVHHMGLTLLTDGCRVVLDEVH